MIAPVSPSPVAFAYGRVSTDKQDASARNQPEDCEAYYHRAISSGKLSRHCIWGGPYVDEDVSGKMPWLHRPSAEVLFRRLQSGDHIIAKHPFRMFRSIKDACDTIDLFSEMKVTLHFTDFPVDLSTPEGRCFFHQMIAWGQLERELVSYRTKDGLRKKKEQGLPVNHKAPCGWKKVGKKAASQFALDPIARRIAWYIVDLIDNQGLSLNDAAIRTRKEGYMPSTVSRERIRYYYHAAKADFPRITMRALLSSATE